MQKQQIIALVLLGMSVFEVQAVKYAEMETCIKNLNFFERCPWQLDCFNDLVNNCLVSKDHQGTKQCQYVKDKWGQSNIVEYDQNKGKEPEIKTPAEERTIIDTKYFSSDSSVKNLVDAWVEKYTTLYNTYTSDKSDANKQAITSYLSAQKTDLIDKIADKTNISDDLIIANVDCDQLCVDSKITNRDAIEHMKKRIACYGPKPVGKTIDDYIVKSKGSSSLLLSLSSALLVIVLSLILL